MFQNFLIKKMLKSQGLPDEQIEMFVRMIEKNPDLFKTIGEEIQHKIKSGMDKQAAAMQVMQKYQDELKKLA